jgi:hypothetical protein
MLSLPSHHKSINQTSFPEFEQVLPFSDNYIHKPDRHIALPFQGISKNCICIDIADKCPFCRGSIKLSEILNRETNVFFHKIYVDLPLESHHIPLMKGCKYLAIKCNEPYDSLPDELANLVTLEVIDLGDSFIPLTTSDKRTRFGSVNLQVLERLPLLHKIYFSEKFFDVLEYILLFLGNPNLYYKFHPTKFVCSHMLTKNEVNIIMPYCQELCLTNRSKWTPNVPLTTKQLPENFIALFSNLKHLDFGSHWEGPIPKEVYYLQSLKTLVLPDNYNLLLINDTYALYNLAVLNIPLNYDKSLKYMIRKCHALHTIMLSKDYFDKNFEYLQTVQEKKGIVFVDHSGEVHMMPQSVVQSSVQEAVPITLCEKMIVESLLS